MLEDSQVVDVVRSDGLPERRIAYCPHKLFPRPATMENRRCSAQRLLQIGSGLCKLVGHVVKHPPHRLAPKVILVVEFRTLSLLKVIL